MFYQMISPTTLLELQRIAGEPQQEPGSSYHEMTVPSLHHHGDIMRRGRQQMVLEGEEEEEGSHWSCT
jgi:hypothetical protein